LARVVLVVFAISLACSAGPKPVNAGRADGAPAVDPRADVCADPGAAAPPFALLQQIFTDDCTTCHSGAGPMVSLSTGVSWANLVQQPPPAPESCGGVLVVPGQPESSYLYQKLSSPTPCYGMQMPIGEFTSDPLPDCVVAIVRAWIAEGAPGPAGDAGADGD
jgi:hypothetical protein